MRTLLIAAATTLLTALNAFAGDCTSAVQLSRKKESGKETILAKNISGKPIVAYVVAAYRSDAKGNTAQVFSGVYSDGDSLAPGASTALGSVSLRQTNPRPVFDYVRLSDGWTCGTASTDEAKAVAARFVAKP